jgi:hypothetical protein
MRESKQPVTWDVGDRPIDDFEHRGWRHSLVLDPESRHVQVFSTIGDGIPADVWHGRAKSWKLPACTPESLGNWLENQTDLFSALCEEYLGDEWNGTNRVGKWSDTGEDLTDQIQYALDNAELESRWLAGDWFGYDMPGLRTILTRWSNGGVMDVEDMALNLVNDAYAEGVVLDLRETARFISGVLIQMDEENQDD